MARGSQRVLLTGFEAFGGARINPSALAVNSLAGESIAGREIVSAVLPCVFGTSQSELALLLEKVDPELVICVGQAGGRDAINIERIAINLDDAEIIDNAGCQPVDQQITSEGPAAYWSNLPIRAIAEAIEHAGIKSEISASAGTFVCNHVFYGLMHALQERPGVLGGFIHLPYLPEQSIAQQGASAPPSMPLPTLIQALRIAVATALS